MHWCQLNYPVHLIWFIFWSTISSKIPFTLKGQILRRLYFLKLLIGRSFIWGRRGLHSINLDNVINYLLKFCHLRGKRYFATINSNVDIRVSDLRSLKWENKLLYIMLKCRIELIFHPFDLLCFNSYCSTSLN